MVAYSLHAHNFDFKLHKVKEKMLSDRTDRATVKSLIMSVYMFWAKTNKINQKKCQGGFMAGKKSKCFIS